MQKIRETEKKDATVNVAVEPAFFPDARSFNDHNALRRKEPKPKRRRLRVAGPSVGAFAVMPDGARF